MRTELLGFYNLDNNRPDAPVKLELEALLGLDPFVLGLVECIGNRTPRIKGYDLIRNTSTRSRQNIGAYVRAGVRVTHIGWTDLSRTWPRTDGPGRHEPRSILHFRADGVQVVIAHQPPKNARPVEPLQLEGINALAQIMAPWHRDGWDRKRRRVQVRALDRPRVLLADMNRRADEPGPGPTTLANRIDGFVATKRIDTAVARGGKLSRARYVETVPREGKPALQLRSDHGHALFVDFTWDPKGATR